MAKATRSVIEVEGADELIAKLKTLGIEARTARNDAAMAAADVWKNLMNDLAPGPHVEATIHTNTDRKVIIEIGPEPDRWYYRFFELGAQPHEITPHKLTHEALAYDDIVVKRVMHRGVSPRPFMRPVADTREQDAVDAFGDYLLKLIERHIES